MAGRRTMFCVSTAIVVFPLVVAAQTERVQLDGREVAVYNLVGRLRVDGGSGDKVVVEVTRVGRDAGQLKLQSGTVRGRNALRVVYPSDRIYYNDSRWNGRTTMTMNDDGTWGDNGSDHYDRRRIEISSRDGLDAHADLHVIIPKGKSVRLRQGVGETVIQNVDGDLDVDVSASRTTVSHGRGTLNIDAGSGGIEITDHNGDVNLDSGSGGATIDGIRGGKLMMDIGSGSLRGSNIDVSELTADVGSGGVRLSAVKAPRVRIETGSGGSDIELRSAPSDVSVEAGSGGVTLRLPTDLDARLDIETGSGSIESDFSVKVNRMERRSMHGTVGSGKGRIRIESGSGSVRLIKN